jgi:tRNA (cytidine32/uridine32-2'-O)-methyltransferase
MIRVVLHQPRELTNIAQVVRAMMNFGLRDLTLVAPREYDAWRIAGIAHRSEAFLERVVQAATLDAALADCVHSIGFSARGRTAKHNSQRPRVAAAEVLNLTRGGTVALVFGPEDTGLDNAALDRCHRLCTIPTRPEYPSLNLAHAVTVMLYEIAMARGDGELPLKPPRRRAPAATLGLLEQAYGDAEAALEAIDFFRTRQRTLVMRTLRRLAQRAGLDQREAMLLRAMAIETARYLRRRDPGTRRVD